MTTQADGRSPSQSHSTASLQLGLLAAGGQSPAALSQPKALNAPNPVGVSLRPRGAAMTAVALHATEPSFLRQVYGTYPLSASKTPSPARTTTILELRKHERGLAGRGKGAARRRPAPSPLPLPISSRGGRQCSYEAHSPQPDGTAFRSESTSCCGQSSSRIPAFLDTRNTTPGASFCPLECIAKTPFCTQDR